MSSIEGGFTGLTNLPNIGFGVVNINPAVERSKTQGILKKQSAHCLVDLPK
jgi:hypothetical protein